jgi:acyl-CoA synthetase (AMP-forming)/AMP-acid ligase II
MPVMAALEAAARAHPGAPALIGLRERLDNDAVVRRARRVGAWIQQRVPSDRAVATLVSPTPSGIAAILGCVAAGRITIPLSPADPPDRLAALLDDARAGVLLTDQAQPPGLPSRTRVLDVRDCEAAANARPSAVAHDPDAPCMVHYTSGSSGRPKGVVVSVYNILFRACQNIDGLRLAPGSRVLTAFGPASSAGIAMVVATLVRGGAVLVASLAADGAGAMVRLSASERADVLVVPAPVLGNLLAPDSAEAAFAHLRVVRLGASAVASADVARWRARLPAGCAITHSYGSTEAMIIAELTVPPEPPGDAPTVAIGHLRPGLEYALIDANGAPVPDGECGELIVRGRYVAAGEWQRGRFVAGRMRPDPARPGTRVFRTGDLLRFGADGMLRFVGRADRQMKINGARVEPAEIEAVIRANAAVSDAAVVPSAAGVLHAFVAAPLADPRRLREALVARLRAALPSPLRPRRISILEALPLLPGGKVDVVTLRAWAAREDRTVR